MSWRQWIKKIRGLLVTALILFLGFWAGALFSESKGIYGSIVWPIVNLGAFLEHGKTHGDFFKIFYGGLSILFYTAIVSFPILLLVKDLSNDVQNESEPEVMFYSEEIASTMQVIENENSTVSEIEDAVDVLMASISSQIVDIFKGFVSLRGIRYAFLVSDPDSPQIIMRVKLAHHFPVTDNDLEVVEWVCSNHTENPYLEAIVKQRDPQNNMEVIGLIRNPGKFRFGFVIFLPKKDIITDTTKSEFVAAASAVQYIAYMDRLYHLMVQFNQSRLRGVGESANGNSRYKGKEL